MKAKLYTTDRNDYFVEKRTRTKWLTNSMIWLFLLFTIGDIVSTFMVTFKHGLEFETNPFLIYGIPLWFLFILRVVVLAAFIYMFIRHYRRLNIYIRYFYIYFLVIFTILLVAVVVNNFSLYAAPVDSVQPYPEELRVQVYQEYIGDMKLIEDVAPEPIKRLKIPLIIWMFLVNMLIFMIWVRIEREHELLG